jgi:hypothetical protein
MTNEKESLYSDEDEINKKYGFAWTRNQDGSTGPRGITGPQGVTDRPCPVGPQGAAGPSGPPPSSCSSGATCFHGVPIEYTPEQLAAFAEYFSDDWENYWDNY